MMISGKDIPGTENSTQNVGGCRCLNRCVEPKKPWSLPAKLLLRCLPLLCLEMLRSTKHAADHETARPQVLRSHLSSLKSAP